MDNSDMKQEELNSLFKALDGFKENVSPNRKLIKNEYAIDLYDNNKRKYIECEKIELSKLISYHLQCLRVFNPAMYSTFTSSFYLFYEITCYLLALKGDNQQEIDKREKDIHSSLNSLTEDDNAFLRARGILNIQRFNNGRIKKCEIAAGQFKMAITCYENNNPPGNVTDQEKIKLEESKSKKKHRSGQTRVHPGNMYNAVGVNPTMPFHKKIRKNGKS